MKKLLLILPVILIGLVSCHDKTSVSYPEPDRLIGREEMIGIMTELSVAEALYQMKYIQVTRYSYLLQQDADSIFRIFGTDKEAYEESMTYYAHHQEELAGMYQEVKANLEKRLAGLPQEPEGDLPQTNGSGTGDRTIKEIRDTGKINIRIRTEEDL